MLLKISILPRLSLVHRVVVGFGVAFVMVLALAILTDANRQRQIDADHSIAHTQSIIDELETTLSIVKDAETGTRGYVITGDPTYLQPYYTALTSIDEHIAQLEVLVVGNTTQVDFLHQLEPKITSRLQISADVVKLRREEGFESAQALVLTGRGKKEMDAVRLLVSKMQAAAHKDLASVTDQSTLNAVGTGWILLTVPFCLGFLALISLQIQHEMKARQLAEQALLASEGKLKAIVENTSDPIYIKDVQGRYTLMNRAGASLFNRSSDEIVGLSDAQILGEEKSKAIQERDRQVIEEGVLLNYESPMIMPGKTIVFNTTKFPYLSPTGELLGLVGISRDVTSDKEAEATLRRQKAELSALNETTLGLLNGLDTQSLLEDITTNTSSLLGIADTYLYVLDPDEHIMIVRTATGRFSKWIGVQVRSGEGLAGRVWQNNKTMFLEDYSAWEHRLTEQDDVPTRAIAEVPLRIGGAVVGVLGMARTGDDASQISPDEVALLSRFAQMASMALQNANLYTRAQQEIGERKRAEEALHELAIRDELTGLFNRRELMRLLTEELARCWRYKHDMSLILLDIDHFKKVNDIYGHQVGDVVLACVADVLKSTVRTVDRPARYGGEEFAIIVPELGSQPTWEFAERLRSKMAASPCVVQTRDGETVSLSITFSIGIASFPSDADSEESLIAAADHALYEAKHAGRNRSVMARAVANPNS